MSAQHLRKRSLSGASVDGFLFDGGAVVVTVAVAMMKIVEREA